MILLDTHIFLWWVVQPDRLTVAQLEAIRNNEGDSLGVSAITCWEVAKLIQLGRIELGRDVGEWLEFALAYPGKKLLPLTPRIAVASTQLPEGFRSDPADEILVATARVYNCPLVTSDRKLREYPHVTSVY
ncbi:MAG: type II toxin-antitoxin system VapC family toxin [Chloroflexi bacterium]|nr:type II toxin-antitoxin system VapC family toxin [Chloroflexota bacterium]